MIRKKIFILSLLVSVDAAANSLEVLHWWTSQGEREAQQILEQSIEKKNIQWNDFAIIGEGGDSAMRVLQMRALSGNPPDAAQIKGPDIGEWAKVGMLEPVDNIVDVTSWQYILPPVVQETVSFDGHYMAVPINIHRVNWLWLNNKIFKKLKLPIPTTWEQFYIIADEIKAAGYLPLAHGRTPWQDALLFESMALSMLGAQKYKQAFVEHDETIINSDDMIAVFENFKRLYAYTDKSMIGKDWFSASQLIATDKAAMQFMGDWAKGMWSAMGKVAMQDYLCVAVPESEGLYSYNIDSFVFFEKFNFQATQYVQFILAHTLLSRQFQRQFSLSKGSIPVRNDINISEFDACSQRSYKDFNHDQLVPSFTQKLATTSQLQSIMTEIISNYFNDPDADAAKTVEQLSLAIRAIN